MEGSAKDRVIVALDVPTRKAALSLLEQLGDEATFFKVGAQLFTEAGPPLLDELKRREKRILLDLKFHDIPNTVSAAVAVAARRGVHMLTVHASGGLAMLEAAREAAGVDGPDILAVTLLTSLATEDVEQVFGRSPVSIVDEVVRLSGLAKVAGIAGVVASPSEVKSIKRSHGDVLRVVTPGIRLVGDDPGDQNRYATPDAAARAGADYVVVGRSITAARDPAAAFQNVARLFAAAGKQGA